jgi:hypothetical protein
MPLAHALHHEVEDLVGALVDHAAEAEELDLLGEQSLVEETEDAAVLDEPLVRLRERGEIQRGAAGGRGGEGELLHEDGLARARRAHHDDHAAAGQAAAQDLIQAGHARRRDGRGFAHGASYSGPGPPAVVSPRDILARAPDAASTAP